MDSASIRRTFTDYMASRGHMVLPSASLVPSAEDPSVLLTTAGMQPFKPYFQGLETPPSPRVTTVQKVFRSTDIDQVGTTARHLTFFEMLGNFSFGDYFKPLATEMAWELSTRIWSLDPERIWATIWEGDAEVPIDDEARGLWLQIGLPAERIVALGDDNFWNAGPTGPCGPCSELYYDRGAEHGCGRAGCAPGCDCDRYMEYWNLVFMQYDRAVDGSLTPLPRPSIDTGSGIERVAAVLQGVHSVFETDAFLPLIGAVEDWTGARYENGGNQEKALRVLSDHARATTMLATDGVIPSNEGRGYILRRVIRRAVQHASRIGLETPFLGRLQDIVIEQLGEFHRDLVRNRDEVRRLLEGEEERFARTLDTGSRLLGEVIDTARERGATAISAEDAFRLHDTYGFPFEVTAEIAGEAGLAVDQTGFDTLMGEQRTRARAAAKGGGDAERVAAFVRSAPERTEFTGYDALAESTEVIAAEDLGDGRALLKLRRSPFYAEGGGQVSDAGTVESDRASATVEAVHRIGDDQALVVRPSRGAFAAGDAVEVGVDAARRRATVANHTGTHLLHRALRDRLGEHVHQAGSAVRPDKLRFDFTYDGALDGDDLRAIEDEVNERVLDGRAVRTFETGIDEARDLGAMMLFGEKYGDVVRVVEIDGYSMELCGGTHAGSTAEVGPFRILSESSVGQGTRRIEAVTAGAALGLLREEARAAEEAAKLARTTPEGLPAAIESLQKKVRELEKAAKAGGGGASAAPDLEALAGGAVRRNGLSVLAAQAPAGVLGDALLDLTDRLKGKLGPSAVVLGAADEGGGVQLVANLSPEAVEAGLSAVDVIRAIAPTVGGGGGGRPQMARAGGKDASRLGEAIDQARALLTE